MSLHSDSDLAMLTLCCLLMILIHNYLLSCYCLSLIIVMKLGDWIFKREFSQWGSMKGLKSQDFSDFRVFLQP